MWWRRVLSRDESDRNHLTNPALTFWAKREDPVHPSSGFQEKQSKLFRKIGLVRGAGQSNPTKHVHWTSKPDGGKQYIASSGASSICQIYTLIMPVVLACSTLSSRAYFHQIMGRTWWKPLLLGGAVERLFCQKDRIIKYWGYQFDISTRGWHVNIENHGFRQYWILCWQPLLSAKSINSGALNEFWCIWLTLYYEFWSPFSITTVFHIFGVSTL